MSITCSKLAIFVPLLLLTNFKLWTDKLRKLFYKLLLSRGGNNSCGVTILPLWFQTVRARVLSPSPRARQSILIITQQWSYNQVNSLRYVKYLTKVISLRCVRNSTLPLLYPAGAVVLSEPPCH